MLSAEKQQEQEMVNGGEQVFEASADIDSGAICL